MHQDRNVEFWSSTGYGSFLGALTRELQALGCPAGQHFQVSQESYWAARSRVARLALRWRCYASYPLRLAGHFATARPGITGVVCTNTFFAPWCAIAAAPKTVPIVHWVFDLFPDVLVAAGSVRADSLITRISRRLVRRTFDRAAANVFLGEQLLKFAESVFGPIPRAHIIHVGADGAAFRRRRPVASDSVGPRRMLYCGNLGRMHDVDTILGALRVGLPEELELEFRGNGAGFRTIEKNLPLTRVRLGGNLQDERWVETMQAADVALVTIKRGAEGLIMPSKTYSALVAGQAVLAVCSASSDLADLVRKHDCGWVVEPGDVDELNRVLLLIATDRAILAAKQANAFDAGHRYYDVAVIARQWSALLADVAANAVT